MISQYDSQAEFEKKEPKTVNQIIEDVNNESSDNFSVDQSQLINRELSEEIHAILQEIEFQNYDTTDNFKYINWETEPISYHILRRAGESEPARMIKNKRRLDFALWGKQPSEFSIQRGARLVFINSEYQPTKEEKMNLLEWERRIFDNLFFPPNSNFPSFPKFIGAAYEDFFDLDDITIELRRDGLGRVVAIHLQDPIIYKPVIKERRFRNNPSLYTQDDISLLLRKFEEVLPNKRDDFVQEQLNPEDIDYLLVYQNRKIAGVTADTVRKFHFFLRSSFRKAQRGYGIVEQGIRLVTHIVNALTMNASNFTNNRMPPGFFAFTGGGVNQLQLEKLKKLFYAYGSGPNNSNRFPAIALNSEKSDAKWVGIRGNSKDLEYHQFMTLLFTIFCQLSGTDPREVSLGAYADAVGKKSLFEESSDGVIKESKDQGAKTFLYHLADSLNTPMRSGINIFEQISGLPIKLKFEGFEIEDKKAKGELITHELSSIKSINDLLAQNDVEKQTFMVGDVNIYDMKAFTNPQVFQAVMYSAQQKAQQEQQQQQMMAQQQQQAQGGEPGGEQGVQPEPGEQQDSTGEELQGDQPSGTEGENPAQEGPPNRFKQNLTDRDRELLDKYRNQPGAEMAPELLR